MEAVYDMLRELAALCALSAVMSLLLPEGRLASGARFVCALLATCAMAAAMARLAGM